MRSFGSLIEKTGMFREPPIPGARLERVQPPIVNRLDEGITELFDHACVLNDLEAAAELIALMQQWHTRRAYKDDEQRRIGVIRLRRLQGELTRRHIMRGTNSASADGQPFRRAN